MAETRGGQLEDGSAVSSSVPVQVAASRPRSRSAKSIAVRCWLTARSAADGQKPWHLSCAFPDLVSLAEGADTAVIVSGERSLTGAAPVDGSCYTLREVLCLSPSASLLLPRDRLRSRGGRPCSPGACSCLGRPAFADPATEAASDANAQAAESTAPAPAPPKRAPVPPLLPGYVPTLVSVDAPPPLIWKWGRFTTADYLVTAAGGATTLVAAIVHPRPQHSLTGGLWFDESVRNAIRVDTLPNRYIFRDASDVGLSLLVSWPFVADALTTAWWLSRQPRSCARNGADRFGDACGVWRRARRDQRIGEP